MKGSLEVVDKNYKPHDCKKIHLRNETNIEGEVGRPILQLSLIASSSYCRHCAARRRMQVELVLGVKQGIYISQSRQGKRCDSGIIFMSC